MRALSFAALQQRKGAAVRKFISFHENAEIH